MLELRNLTCRFGGVTALSDVSLTIPRRQVYGIIGPNGAGKTTLLNIISGVTRTGAGQVLLEGKRIDHLPVYRIARRGIARTFQQTRQLREATVLDQLIIAQHRRGRSHLLEELLYAAPARRERVQRRERADALLDLVGLGHAAGRLSGTLAHGDQRRLELARALAQAPDYLLLDEPAAGLSAGETGDLERLLQELVLEGVSVVLVEHDVDLVMRTCDRVALLNRGQLLAEGPAREVQSDPAVMAAYLGEEA